MEIERKFLVDPLPEDLGSYPFHEIEQAYLNTAPVVRIRRQDDSYYLTYKGSGLLAREEYNLPLNKESYYHLREKADGRIISKTRYCIPEKNGFTIELDIFHGDFDGLVLAEVEFPDIETALSYQPPEWFVKDVTQDPAYHNSTMSRS